MIVAFQFTLRQKVKIVEIDRPGFVVACLHDSEGEVYKVMYWCNGERKTEWAFAEELVVI